MKSLTHIRWALQMRSIGSGEKISFHNDNEVKYNFKII